MNQIKKICATTLVISLFTFTTVFAYHFRGYQCRNVGYGNQPVLSDPLYKIISSGDWVVSCTQNPDNARMKYEIVNSENQVRGNGTTTSYTFGPLELSSSGQEGHYYKERITKMSSNPLKAYLIESSWDADANQ